MMRHLVRHHQTRVGGGQGVAVSRADGTLAPTRRHDGSCRAPTPERWERVKEITSGGAGTPRDRATARGSTEACAGRRGAAPGGRIPARRPRKRRRFPGDAPAVAPSPAAPRRSSAHGSRRPWRLRPDAGIGPYRIIRELGQGGMGVVYLAERADAAFEKKTAIKVVRGGLAERARAEAIPRRAPHPGDARASEHRDGCSTAARRRRAAVRRHGVRRRHPARRLLRDAGPDPRAAARSCSSRSAPRCSTRTSTS